MSIHMDDWPISNLILDYKQRYLMILLSSWMVCFIYILVVGLGPRDIDLTAPKIYLNNGPYEVETTYVPAGKHGLSRYSYTIVKDKLKMEITDNDFKSIYRINNLQSAVLVQDRSLFDPLYYFVEMTYWKEKNKKCRYLNPFNCTSDKYLVKEVMPIERLNHSILDTWRVMFIFICVFWIFCVLMGLFVSQDPKKRGYKR